MGALEAEGGERVLEAAPKRLFVWDGAASPALVAPKVKGLAVPAPKLGGGVGVVGLLKRLEAPLLPASLPVDGFAPKRLEAVEGAEPAADPKRLDLGGSAAGVALEPTGLLDPPNRVDDSKTESFGWESFSLSDSPDLSGSADADLAGAG
ncbi:hypothetical protein HYQ46_005152 [Verticillium longisporum]|nr:hypothetical protein HYQ46_005152 [Verticillium longisporum]